MNMKFYLGLLIIFFVSCNNQVQEEEFDLEGFNWKALRQCFEDAMEIVPEIKDQVKEMVELIKQLKFKKAITIASNLIKKGVKVIKDCVKRFKTKSVSSLKAEEPSLETVLPVFPRQRFPKPTPKPIPVPKPVIPFPKPKKF